MPEPPPLVFSEVLEQERQALRSKDDDPSAPFTALCFSGGGIRSATFALGVIQGLAEKGVLGCFDYLSTVSGGGYIGAWLTAWKQREHGIGKVIPQLNSHTRCGPEIGPDPVQHLREYNNYLAPRLGLFSVDMWTLIATVARNMFLNWLVFVPLLLAVLMAPRIVLSLAKLGETYSVFYGDSSWISFDLVALILPLASGLFFSISIYNILRYLPGVGAVNHSETDFLKYCLFPLILSAATFITNDSWFSSAGFDGPAFSTQSVFGRLILYVMAAAFAPWVAYLIFCGKSMKERLRWLFPVSAAVLLASWSAASGACLLIADIYPNVSWPVYATLAFPLILTMLALGAWVFIGLTSLVLEDQDREWMARAGAWASLVVVLWIAVCALVLILPQLAFTVPAWGKSALAVLGGAAGWTSALAGRSSKTPAANQDSTPAGTPTQSLVMSVAAKLAAPVFVIVFLVVLAMLSDWVLAVSGLGAVSAWQPNQTSDAFAACPGCAWWQHEALIEGTRWEANAALALGFLGFAWLMARYININKFSLQQMYRNRLVRAYLGASNPQRQSNDFTGFAANDNLQMHELEPQLKPFHVINVTLNLTSRTRLAWQERKAESFTITPLHCGSADLGYRSSQQYGGPKGITMGTAVAISGAAASPAMGYHSSRVIAFIMTLFNARLGCWLGNPGPAGEKTWQNEGPTSAIASFVREAFGLTGDSNPYVYLSDGGHFENLGLYEMVRRRCRYIVVSDGGCDPEYTYEDLGNALRKIRIDMKIPIEFDDGSFESLRKQSRRYAIARIRYSCLPDGGDDGYLLYLKPMLLGNEPPDVTSYQTAHPAFPHQSTAEQFFDESQTESHRILGLHTVHEICEGWQLTGGIPEFFQQVSKAHLKDESRGRTTTAGSPA